jgi:tripartite ATP-independent transporter DctM subunit
MLLALGLPVFLAFGAVSVIFVAMQWGPEAIYIVATSALAIWTEYVLVSVPMFVLMGCFLERSGIAQDLYEAMYKWMGPVKGGLAMGTVAICAIFAAMAGVSAVGTITMGLIALPSMLAKSYDKKIAVGCISAGGTLGILIPPSIPMIVFCSLTGDSVGQMFMAGVIPGILMAAIFIIYIGVRCQLNPSLAPPVPPEERMAFLGERLISLKSLMIPAVLVLAVLGLMYFGVTTATEASGVGAFGAFLLLFIYRRLNRRTLDESLVATLRLTGMVMWILLGGKIFSQVYTALGAASFVSQFIIGLDINRWLIVTMMILILIFLGCFMDPGGITLICAPVFVPIIKTLGFNPIWFGIIFTICLEMGYITPPFGLNLFYMKSLVPKQVSMMDIYRSILPYVILEVIAIALLMAFPQLALWLPEHMIKPAGR